jgi:lipopolysaccharide assembly outer membrane protein LptD (OstA)
MKRSVLSVLVLLAALTGLAVARQQKVSGQQLQLPAPTSQQPQIKFTADFTERENNVFHFRGNVEARITSLRPGEDHFVIHADEMDYNSASRDIEPRGNVHVTIEKAQ